MELGRRKKYRPNIAVMIVMTIITVGVVYACVLRTSALEQRLGTYEDKISALNLQIEEASAATEKLEEQRVYMQTRQYIEEMAKNILGLVEPDELLVKPEQ